MTTHMKSLNFKLLLFLTLLFPFHINAQDSIPAPTLYDRHIERYTSLWENLIPRYSKIQFAGSMGMFSFGIGWDYYRHHWETDLLFGFVPKTTRNLNAESSKKRHTMATFTAKQNYIPWRVPLHKSIDFEPLTTGLYINTLLDRDFWVQSPDKYPKGYYFFSTRVRTHIFLGERVTFKFNNPGRWHKSVTLFYELSSCDLYILNKFGNKYLKPKDYLSLSFGLKFQIL